MDLKKPINISALLNFKNLLKGSSLEHSKLSLSFLILSSLVGMTFIYLGFDRYHQVRHGGEPCQGDESALRAA